MLDWLAFFVESIPTYWQGLLVTLELTVVGLLMGFGLGLLSALGRVYGGKWVRSLAIGYIEILRGTPLLVQLFLVYYGLPGLGITLSRMLSAFLALGLNSGAYQAEYLRGAILSVGEGQLLAGRAIGLSRWQAIRNVILPQALRLVIPAWSNEPVSLLKSTSIAFLIAVPDLMTRAKSIAARTYDPIGSYFGAAVVYLIVVALMTWLLKAIEKAVQIPGLDILAKKA